MTINVDMKISNLKTENWAEIIDMKIGKYSCGPISNNSKYSIIDSKISFNCDIGSADSEVVNDLMISSSYGNASINTNFRKYPLATDPFDSSKNNYYYIKIFPKITNVNFSMGLETGQQVITITGTGFVPNNISIAIGSRSGDSLKNRCNVITADIRVITCRTTPLTINLPVSDIETPPGLRYRIKSNASIENFNSNTPDDITYDSTKTILELGDTFNSSTPVFVNADGRFCPLYDGYYRFWVYNKENIQLSLKNPITNSFENAIKFQGNTPLNDFFGNPSTRSDFIFMKKGICIDMRLTQMISGSGYYRVATEICEKTLIDGKIPSSEDQVADKTLCSDHTKSSTSQLSSDKQIYNKSKQVVRLSVKILKIFRLTYSIKVPLLKKFELKCGNTSKLFLNSNDTTSADISTFFTNLTKKDSIVKRKAFNSINLPVNELNESSMSSSSITDMSNYFINLPVAGEIPLVSFFNDKSGGDSTAVSYNFIYVVNESESNVLSVSSLINTCTCKYLNSDDQSTDFSTGLDCSILKLQEASKKIQGNMKFKVSYTTDTGAIEESIIGPINVDSLNSSLIEKQLDQIAMLANKVIVTDTNYINEDQKTFHIKIASDRSFSFTDLSGAGINQGKAFIDFSDIIRFNKNFFFDNIPTEMIRMPINSYSEVGAPEVKLPLTQILLYSVDYFGNEIQAVCDFGICDFKILPKSYLPTVTNVGFASPVYGATTNANPSYFKCASASRNCLLTIGYATAFVSPNPNDGTQLFSLSMSNIVAGSYVGTLTSSLGVLDSSNTFIQVFPLTLSSFSPMNISEIGGTQVTIIGKNFPTSLVVPFSDIPNDLVTVGGSNCIVASRTLTQIVCMTTKKLVTNFTTKVVISFKGQSVTSSGDLTWLPQAESISITNPTTFSFSTGERKIIRTTFSSTDINGTSNVNFSQFDLSKSNVSVVHGTQGTLTPIESINPLTSDSTATSMLDFILPSLVEGQYKLFISLVRNSSKANVSITPITLFVELKDITISLPTILSIYPNEGSPQGGTLITINGNNFVSQNKDQTVNIDNTLCIIQTTSSNEITCITKGLTTGESNLINKPLTVIVSQFNKYNSICSSTCTFTYKSSLFAKISKVNRNITNPTSPIPTIKYYLIGYALDSILTINTTYNLYQDSLINLKDMKEYKDEEVSTRNSIQRQCKLTGSKCNYTSQAILDGIIATYKINSVSSSNAELEIMDIKKNGNFKFYIQTDKGLIVYNTNDSNLNIDKISTDSNVLFNYSTKPVTQPSISNVIPNTITQYGNIITIIATDNKQFPLQTESERIITILGNKCKLLDSITQQIPGQYQCFLFPDSSTYQDKKSQNIEVTIFNKTFSTYNIPISFDSSQEWSPTLLNFGMETTDISTTIVERNYNQLIKIQALFLFGSKDLSLFLIFDDNIMVPFTYAGQLTQGPMIFEVYMCVFPNGLPPGLHKLRLYDPARGIAKLANNLGYFTLDNKNMSVIDIPKTVSSYKGGLPISIKGNNFNNLITKGTSDNLLNNSVHSVKICGISTPIISSSSTQINIKTPEIVYVSQPLSLSSNPFNIDLLKSQYTELISLTAIDVQNDIQNLIDDKIGTTIKTLTNSSKISIKIKDNYASLGFRLRLASIKILPFMNSFSADFLKGQIVGIKDDSSSVIIYTINNNFDMQWESIDITTENQAISFVEIQYIVNNKEVQIDEIKYIGQVVNIGNTNNAINCNVDITYPYNDKTLIHTQSNVISYNFNLFYTLLAVNDTPCPVISYGTSLGGTSIKFKLSSVNVILTQIGSQLVKEDFTVSLYGNLATVLSVDQANETLTILTPQKTKAIFNKEKPLIITHKILGECLIPSTCGFNYRDFWSNRNTWGGDVVPRDGELVEINNLDVVLDVANISLSGLSINNGSLAIFDDKDYTISTKYIMINNGRLQIGTEASPFQSRKLTITLTGTQNDSQLTMYGNKVIGLNKGILDIHGKPRTLLLSALSKTGTLAGKSITLKEPTNWVSGETLVIANNDFDLNKTQELLISGVSNPTSAAPVVSITNALLSNYYSAIETYTGTDGSTDSVDLRSEVALLTRNIVIQSDANSANTEYGFHIIIADSNKKPTEPSSIARMSFIQLIRGGQAFQTGTFPINFNLIGNAKDSFIRGVSIMKSFNRGINLNGVNNLRLERNLLYDNKGCSIRLESSIERYNTISDNIVINTRKSNSLQQIDIEPASYLLSHPTNYIQNNLAVGSEGYGIWMEYNKQPTGAFLGHNLCPDQEVLGTFDNNISHSNKLIGFYIYPSYNPQCSPCKSDSIPLKATFNNLRSYSNNKEGFLFDEIGYCEFNGLQAVENLTTNIKINKVIQLGSGKYNNQQSMPVFSNSIVIGTTSNLNTASVATRTKYGLILPRNGSIIIDNARFYNFAGSDSIAILSGFNNISTSDITNLTSVTTFVNYLKFDGTILNRINLYNSNMDIIADIDGSLAGSPPTTYNVRPVVLIKPVNWITSYKAHLDNKINSCSSCVVQSSLGTNILVCSTAVNQQVRSISFDNFNAGLQIQMNIIGITGNKVTDDDIVKLNNDIKLVSDSNDITKAINSSIYPFNHLKNPSGWIVTFITGCRYLVSFDTDNKEFKNLNIIRSREWESNDAPINIIYKYSKAEIYEFTVMIKDNAIQPITDFTVVNQLQTPNINSRYGAGYHDKENKAYYLRIDGNDNISSTNLLVESWICPNQELDCSPDITTPEGKIIKKWSKPRSWGEGNNRKVPVDGDDVIILSNWIMILDVPTADLNSLKIEGKLIFDENAVNVVLKSHNILITNTGILQIGSEEKPIVNKAKIILTGNESVGKITISENVTTFPKSLINLNKLIIIGKNKAPYTSKLLNTIVQNSSNSKIIKVSPGLLWEAGDEVAITSTSENTKETELFSIIAYNIENGELELSSIPKYNHIGYLDSEIDILKENPLDGGVNLDERAIVVMVSRTITIQGDELNSNKLGCNILTTNIMYNGNQASGNTIVKHAEVSYCGQKDTNTPCLLFNLHGNIDSNHSESNQSVIQGVSFNKGNFLSMQIDSSFDIKVKDVVSLQPLKNGLVVSGKSSYLDIENFIVLNQINYSSDKLKNNSCFIICNEGQCSSSIILKNTRCAGAEGFGYQITGNECSSEPVSETIEEQISKYNYAHSTTLGGVFFHDQRNLECITISNFIVYNNLQVGFSGFPMTKKNVIVKNVLSANNEFGISINSGVVGETSSIKTLNNAVLIGKTKFSQCMNLPGHQAGIIMSMSVSNAPKPPLSENDIPLFVTNNDSIWSSSYILNKISLVNWEDECNYDSFAIRSNSNSTDSHSVTYINSLYAEKVISDNLIYIDSATERTANFGCGNSPCTGALTLSIKIGEVREWKEDISVKNYSPKYNTKWDSPLNCNNLASICMNMYDMRGDLKYQYTPNTIFPQKTHEEIVKSKIYLIFKDASFTYNKSYNQSIVLEKGSWIIPNLSSLLNCINIFTWNAYYCPSTKEFAMLTFESKNYEKLNDDGTLSKNKVLVNDSSLSIHPISIDNNLIGYSNKVNSHYDHACQVGVCSSKRIPRFYSLMLSENNPSEQSIYSIIPKGATPGLSIWELINSYPNQPSQSVYVKLDLKRNRKVRIMNGNKIVNDSCNYKSDCCCFKKKLNDRNFEFLIKSAENCKCTIIEVASLSLYIDIPNVTEDEIKKSDKLPVFIDKISSLLKIDKALVSAYTTLAITTRRNLGNSVVKLEIEILQSSPQDILNRSITDTNAILPTLDSLQTIIVDSLKNNNLQIPFLYANIWVSQISPLKENEVINPSNIIDSTINQTFITLTTDTTSSTTTTTSTTDTTSTASTTDTTTSTTDITSTASTTDTTSTATTETTSTSAIASTTTSSSITSTASIINTSTASTSTSAIPAVSSISSTTTPSTTASSKSSTSLTEISLTNKDNNEEEVWYWYIILIGCVVVLTISLIIVYFVCCKSKNDTQSFKMVDTKSVMSDKKRNTALEENIEKI